MGVVFLSWLRAVYKLFFCSIDIFYKELLFYPSQPACIIYRP